LLYQIEHYTTAVAVKRKYESARRQEQARQTRRAILEAAGRLFVDPGYAATPLTAVATEAGVAVQTLYAAFGTKQRLLSELVDVTIAGDDEPIPTMQRDWFREALAAETAEAHLRVHVRGTCGVLARMAPIMDVLRAAGAQDPSLASLWQQDSDPRLEVQTAAARSLMAKPGAKADLSVEHAADLLYGLLSPQLYLLFIRDRGWAADRWEQWVSDTLHAQLCG
jgi:AcrR family transcriptional regulator